MIINYKTTTMNDILLMKFKGNGAMLVNDHKWSRNALTLIDPPVLITPYKNRYKVHLRRKEYFANDIDHLGKIVQGIRDNVCRIKELNV